MSAVLAFVDPPDEEHIRSVCRPGAGDRTCRYLVGVTRGQGCAKLSAVARHIDGRAANGTLSARANNCAGRGMR